MSFLHLLFKRRFAKASALGLLLGAGGVLATPYAGAVSARKQWCVILYMHMGCML